MTTAVDLRLTRADLSPDQRTVYESVLDWTRSVRGSNLLTLGGYAGCLSGDTKLMYGRGARNGVRPITLRDLYLKFNGHAGSGRGAAQRWVDLTIPTFLYALWPDETVEWNRIVAVYESGMKPVMRITFDKDRELVCTAEHPIATPGGEFIPAGNLLAGGSVLARSTWRLENGKGRRPIAERPPRIIVNTKYHPIGAYKAVVSNGITYEYMRVARARLVVEAAMNDLPYDEFVHALKYNAGESAKFKYLSSDVDVHHEDEDTLNDDISNLKVLPCGEHARLHTTERNSELDRPEPAKILGIEQLGEEMTYDIQMESPANNFVADGIIVHNSGKSTLLSLFAAETNLKVAYICYTGRASSVLGRKLRAAGVATTNRAQTDDERKINGRWGHLFYSPFDPEASQPFCGTIHRLIYRPLIIDETEELYGWEKREELDRRYDLIVIDEASMVDANMIADVLKHGIRILAVGDHGQLPPVMGDGSLMSNPTLRLEKIHRQAEGSPIIRLSRAIREDRRMARELADGRQLVFGSAVHARRVFGETVATPRLESAFLCWRNATRVHINRTAREYMGFAGKAPQTGEPLIALRNYPPVYNGMRGLLVEATTPHDDWWRLRSKLVFPDEGIGPIEYNVCRDQFHRTETFRSIEELDGAGIKVDTMSEAGRLFDFGYAMTVHKSQGSQFSHAIVVADWGPNYEDEQTRRLAYTAVTRAAERLTVLT